MDRNFIDCKDWDCFAKGNLNKCFKCKRGEVYVLCPHCCEKHVITSSIIRIDCKCGGGFIPCYNVCEFVNEELRGSDAGGKKSG